MIHTDIKLVSSNQRKIEEFKRFGLNIQIDSGIDLKEVQGDLNDVIIHKAIDAGVGNLVEDTILIVDDKEVVDIRWNIDELRQKPDAKIFWITSLAVLDANGFIYIYRGEVRCQLIDNIDTLVVPNDAFGFDPYLVPVIDRVALKHSFYDLDKKGVKDNYSPRKKAVDDVMSGYWIVRLNSNSVPAWTGEYQNN